jgi:hypothetical protein
LASSAQAGGRERDPTCSYLRDSTSRRVVLFHCGSVLRATYQVPAREALARGTSGTA